MGKKVEESNGALLVIDIQEDYTGRTARPPFPYKDSERLIANVNGIIAKTSKKNIVVIYIRHEFGGLFWETFSKIFYWGTDIKGTPGTEIDKRINIISEYCFKKPMPNAFSNPELDVFLKEHHIHKLYLVGLDAQRCVQSTAKGALRRGYDVTIIKDAIILKTEKKWDKLLKKFAKEGITLISNGEFLGDEALKTRARGTKSKVVSQ
jgi:nicotinamidase/pyrazinamidase